MKSERVFVSLPADEWLTKQENKTKWAIVESIEALGYTAEVFLDPRGKKSLAASQAWNAIACEAVMRQCEGCAVLGFPRWKFTGNFGQVNLPTEYNHYEGAVAHTLDLPLLVLVQSGVLRRVIFDPSYKGFVGLIPDKPTPKWLTTPGFQVPFKYWREQLAIRRDVFLGFSGKSEPLAREIKLYLETTFGLKVLDWKADFVPGNSILHQIEEASKRCGAGIFLFTRDDSLIGDEQKDTAAPRDNVVFEAGYFIASKGKSKVLIIREEGAKMPADLGGDIYANLPSRENIDAITHSLRQFVHAL